MVAEGVLYSRYYNKKLGQRPIIDEVLEELNYQIFNLVC